MKNFSVVRVAVVAACGFLCAGGAMAQNGVGLANEMPATVTPTYDGFDYETRDVMIPMRDGVKLHTVILVPKGAKHAGILMTRTPYNATALTNNTHSSHMAAALYGYDNAVDVIVDGGYIRVVQDVRGKYGSEGDYVMNRPLVGPLNASKVDHATDTYDTIDWLVKHLPESNGKVGIIGISYDGFTPLMALFHPHPALKVSVPMNPMVDGWMGDDWFHNGAFRQQNMPYVYEQDGSRTNEAKWWTSNFDDYDTYMRAGSAGELGRRRGLNQMGFWKKLTEHPSYDAFWQQQAMDKLLAKEPLKVPMMLVASMWDQEDIYGAMAVYKALKPKDVNGDMVYLTMGPWYHGQEIGEASNLGAIKWGSDTGAYFRKNILGPFLAKYLQDEPHVDAVAPVNAFESGTNRWEKLSGWPSGCAGSCAIKGTPIYLGASTAGVGTLAMAGGDGYEEYVSDPAKPVPFRARPSQPTGYDGILTWTRWLVDDQREASGRPDVMTWTSDVLKQPMKIAGQPMVNLVAATTGTDADWVVKLIDVYPDEVAGQQEMGGYQLAVAMDIFRGRYRESLEHAKAIEAGAALTYKFALPNANHVFLPGHRVMVQVQSSWFPLYDRNPQTFVENIFFAQPQDYKKATQRIYHSSFIELPVVAKESN